MLSNFRRFFSILFLFVATMTGRPGVLVSQDVSPGGTSWPGTPIIQTMTNPAVQTPVGESFTSVGGCSSYSQTFTVTQDFVLQTISIYAGGGTGTGAGTNMTLRLVDLGSQTAPNPSSYPPGTDMFDSGSGLPVSYVPQTVGVLQFDFTDSDQVTLRTGHLYAFEIDGALNTAPFFWWRATNNSYSSGAAYRDHSWINGNNARDFGLAVYGAAPVTNPPTSGVCTVDWNDQHQRMDGFGGGVVFLSPASLDPVTDANMDTLFGTNANQLALTLLRVRIDPNTNWSDALSDTRKAVMRGAGVLATPWTPPYSMKDNNGPTNGSVLPSQYANYGAYLRLFADYMASNGAPLRAISVQNEPDARVTYESCVWTGAQFLNFFRTNAGALGNTPIMMPESLGYNFSYSDPTLNDPIAVTNVALIGGHLYGVSTIQDYPNGHNKGKPTWMTEFLLNDQTIESAIETARQVHDCLTIGNMSAYIWWKCLGDANGLADAAGLIQKRGYMMSQFSRFVRPGDFRIGTTNIGAGFVSAYKNANTGQCAIVAINTNSSAPITLTVVLTNFTADSVTPWITSATQSMAPLSSIAVSNSTFAAVLPPLSIVTFVAQPAPGSAYQQWIAGYGLSGSDALPEADFDGDGVANVLEFILGGDPTLYDADTTRPTYGFDGPSFLYEFRRSGASNVPSGYAAEVYYSTDLSSWTRALNGVDGVIRTEYDDFFGPGIDKVSVQLPQSLAPGGSLFVRLAASLASP